MSLVYHYTNVYTQNGFFEINVYVDGEKVVIKTHDWDCGKESSSRTFLKLDLFEEMKENELIGNSNEEVEKILCDEIGMPVHIFREIVEVVIQNLNCT